MFSDFSFLYSRAAQLLFITATGTTNHCEYSPHRFIARLQNFTSSSPCVSHRTLVFGKTRIDWLKIYVLLVRLAVRSSKSVLGSVARITW